MTDAASAPVEMGTSPPTRSLYERLGGEASITEIVSEFARGAHTQLPLAPYFMNAHVDGQRVGTCLVRQLSAATGGLSEEGRPIRYPGADGLCRDMHTIHAGMGVTYDLFDLTVVNLVAALVAKGATDEDLVVIGRVFRGMQGEIVSEVDPEGTRITYHRIGGYSAIERVVDDFVTRVVMDETVNGFFDLEEMGPQGILRLKVCLARQVCMVSGGPCLYGQEVDGLRWHLPPADAPEPSPIGDAGAIAPVEDAGAPPAGDASTGVLVTEISVDNPCKNMVESHQDVTDAAGAAINGDHFVVFVGHLTKSLEAAGVDGQDIAVIVQGLRPTCHDIAEDTANCPGRAPPAEAPDASLPPP